METSKRISKKNKLQPSTVIVILGGGMIQNKKTGNWRTTGFNEGDNFGIDASRLRVEAANYLYQNNQSIIILASGGKGQYKDIKGVDTLAAVIKKELIDLDVPARCILKEDKSGNSFEQLLNLAKLTPKNKWIAITIISNKYHLPRIKAMLKFAPDLPKLFKSIKINLISAEKICLKYDKIKWQKIINQAYQSPAMRQRIKLEEKGIKDIKQGKYKFK